MIDRPMSPEEEQEQMINWLTTEIERLTDTNTSDKSQAWLDEYDQLLDDIDDFLEHLNADVPLPQGFSFEDLVTRSRQLTETS